MAHAVSLDHSLEQPWIDGPMWLPIKTATVNLSEIFHGYHDYLIDSAKRASENRKMMFPVRTADESQSLEIIYPKYIVKPGVSSRYKSLVDHVSKVDNFVPVCVDEYTPPNTRLRRYYIDNLKSGIPYKCMHLKFSAGNNLGSHNFIWRVGGIKSESEVLNKNAELVQSLNKELPTYHTRAMRRAFMQKASLICNVQTKEARYIYKHLSGDSSAADTSNMREVDLRVQQAFDMQDPDILTDLREHNSGQPKKYSIFFDKSKEYLENVVETAVDDRRHDVFTHLAQAISVPDLLEQVKLTCPPDTPIPSEQWLRLQFAPKNPSSYASIQYTGNLKVKFQVQSRQLRKTHMDCHYASAVFRYLKELAVKFREYSTMVCMDDKHHCKVGEPGHPVAAVDRGKRVVVSQDKVFAVSDHDFTKFSVIPSVTFLIDIPESVDEGSFYRGQVYVGVKNLVLEPSSPLRHIAELEQILIQEGLMTKPVLCLYSDGGPDHRLTYLSVQLALVCLFLSGNFDMLVAARTPPMASWKNPPKRIMSILNLALQAVGLMRAQVSDECEQKLKSANGIKKMRDIAKDPAMRQEIADSFEPVKILLTQMFQRLKLKDTPFKCFPAASEEIMETLWRELGKYGGPIGLDNLKQQDLKKVLKDRPELVEFLNHCTTSRSYFFCIKKCGAQDCQICTPPCLPPDVFAQLHTFPDPVPGDDGHYKSFEDLFGTDTTEEHCPSFKPKQSPGNLLITSRGHGMPFSPSAQTANRCKMTVRCIDCEKPRVIHASVKLTEPESALLERVLALYHYSCGSELQELKPADDTRAVRAPRIISLLDKVFVRANLTCQCSVEIPYFSSKSFPPVCFYCAAEDDLETQEGQYPVCKVCRDREILAPTKRKRNLWKENYNKKLKK